MEMRKLYMRLYILNEQDLKAKLPVNTMINSEANTIV